MAYYIKRLIALALIGGAAYCVWPRQTSMLKFNTPEIVALQVEGMKQARDKQWFGHMITYYKIFDKQYEFPPFAAMKMAVDYTRGVSMFRSAADDVDREEAREPLRLYFENIKKHTSADFDPINAAAFQVRVWDMVREGLKDEAIIKQESDLLIYVYGGDLKDPKDIKRYLLASQAFAAAFKEEQVPSWDKVEKNLQKGWPELRKAVQQKKK